MATRRGREIRRAWVDFETDANNYERLFASLFQTSIKFNGLEKYLDPNVYGLNAEFILKVLYSTGRIAYHKKLNLWLPYWTQGEVNIVGEPKTVTLWGKNGANIPAKRSEVALFKATPNGLILLPYLRKKAALIADFDNAIKQNLDAIKECTAIITDDKELADGIRAADEQRRAGAAVVCLPRAATNLNKLDIFRTNGTYHITNLIDDRRSLYIECMHIVGVRTPLEKTERVITDEQAAENAEADAYIGTIVKEWNRQAAAQGMDDLIAEFEPLRELDYIRGTTTNNNGDFEIVTQGALISQNE